MLYDIKVELLYYQPKIQTMTEEMIEEIDITGKTIAVHPRSRLKQVMFPHKASLVVPKAKDGRFIISKRSATQEPFPDTWVCAIGGKVSHGESFVEAAKRETKEESDMDLDNKDLEYVTEVWYDREDYRALFTIFTTKEPIDINNLKPNPEEVQFFKEITLDELSDELADNPEKFAPTFRAAARAFSSVLKEG